MIWSRVARGRWLELLHTFLPTRRAAPRSHAAGSSPGARALRARVRPIARPLLGGTLAIVLASLVGVGLAGLFGQLAADGATASEAGVLLGLVLTASLGGLLIFDLHEAVSTLVADSDLELLRRAPISAVELFALKIVDAFPRTSLLLFVLGLPAMIAFHAFYPVPFWGWLAIPLELVSLWAIPLGLGIAAAITMLLAVPARRAREALGLLSTLTLFLLWFANSFLLPRLARGESDPIAGFRSALMAAPQILRHAPGQWAADMLVAAVEGSKADWIAGAAALVAAASLALMIAGWVASIHLEAAQSRIASGSAPRAAGARVPTRRVVSSAKRSLIRATLARDALLLSRDWTVMGDVLTAAVLWTLLPLVGAPLYDVPAVALARAMLLTLTVGLGYEIAARAFPFERRGMAWMRLAPVAASRWVFAKWVASGAASLPLVLLAAASMAFGFHLAPRELVETLCIVLPALGLALVVGLWTGTRFGRPDWTSPRAMLSLGGRIAATLLLIAQAGFWLMAILAAERYRYSLPRGLLLWAPALLAATLAALPFRSAADRIATREGLA
jgi:hypothetical protein